MIIDVLSRCLKIAIQAFISEIFPTVNFLKFISQNFLGLDPNSANLDPDLNSVRCLTPDSHSVNLDPKHWENGNFNVYFLSVPRMLYFHCSAKTGSPGLPVLHVRNLKRNGLHQENHPEVK